MAVLWSRVTFFLTVSPCCWCFGLWSSRGRSRRSWTSCPTRCSSRLSSAAVAPYDLSLSTCDCPVSFRSEVVSKSYQFRATSIYFFRDLSLRTHVYVRSAFLCPRRTRKQPSWTLPCVESQWTLSIHPASICLFDSDEMFICFGPKVLCLLWSPWWLLQHRLRCLHRNRMYTKFHRGLKIMTQLKAWNKPKVVTFTPFLSRKKN
jgi:hypothetical protein